MRSIPLCAALLAAVAAGCGSSDPEPTGCAVCSADATCVQRATGELCLCNPSHVGDGRTCAATGLQPGAPWPAQGGNAAHSGQSIFSGPQARPSAATWRFATADAGGAALNDVGSPVVAADGTIYFACADGKIYAVDRAGAARWSYVETAFRWATPAIGADGTLYVHGTENQAGKLVALDPSAVVAGAPTVRWSIATGVHDSGFPVSAPVVGAGGTVYVATDGQLSAVTDGGTSASIAWSKVVGGEASPAIDASGTIYFPASSGRAHAFRPGDGASVWSSQVGPMGEIASALGPDGTFYVLPETLTAYDLVALATDTGQTRWSSSDVSPFVLAVGADTTVYVSGAGGLHALDARGQPKPGWPVTAGGVLRASPAIGADGTVYVGADDALVAISDGAVEWSFPVGALIGRSAPAIGADGTVYVGDTAGYLHAFAP